MPTTRVSRQARKDFDRLTKVYVGAVAAALRSLAQDPLSGKPLKGGYTGLRSLRVGTYRVVYGFDPRANVVDVVWIRHRSEAYRDAR